MEESFRNFKPSDADAVNRLALRAFEEFSNDYTDWENFAEKVATMSSLSECGELIIAEADGQIIGAVAYVAPHRPKPVFFATDWAILRMLVVEPAYRGHGMGRRLTQECIDRARRDGAPLIALHTSPIMQVALPMYRRMGFEFFCEVPAINGVPYGIYTKRLRDQAEPNGF